MAVMRPTWRRRLDPFLAALLVATFLTPAVAERRRRPAEGYLEIVSSNGGADVFVGGERVGAVPLPERLTLPVGEHSVKVSKRGYTQHLEVVRISRRKTTVVSADLLAISGVLRVVASVEGARVFVDGDYLGMTPIEQDVDPGEHALRVTARGYYDHERAVEVVAGEATEVGVELERLPPDEDPTVVEPPRARRWYEQWWVWTAVGAVVVAVAVAVPLAVGSSSDICAREAGWPSCDDTYLFDFSTGR